MRCIIVDDDEMSRLHVARLCKRIDSLQVVESFSDALLAYKYLEKHPVDLMLLDIEMPGFSGIELVQQLTNPPAVIFITSKESYAINTFDFIETVVDYVVKPISLPRLLQSVRRFEEKNKISSSTPSTPTNGKANEENLTQASNHFFVKSDRKYVRIDLNELLYIETVGDYSIFKTKEKQHIVHATLKSIRERLQHPDFLKVHRSFIVNLSKIKDIEDNNLLIEGKIIPISRTHKTELMEKIMPL